MIVNIVRTRNSRLEHLYTCTILMVGDCFTGKIGLSLKLGEVRQLKEIELEDKDE